MQALQSLQSRIAAKEDRDTMADVRIGETLDRTSELRAIVKRLNLRLAASVGALQRSSMRSGFASGRASAEPFQRVKVRWGRQFAT